jgi:hypothetical protein
MLLAAAITIVVILPLFIIGLRHKKSIFHNNHNVVMLKQIINNLPNGAKKIALKFKLTK